jgi:NAD(P)-dependent dehydrogenase (short-subunit alcohol dehydrogenase family)
LHLVQRLATRRHGKAPLWLVTCNNAVALDSADTEMPDLSHSSVSGMAKTIALEHPELWGGMVDIPRDPGDDALTELARELEQRGGEDHILLWNSKRFVARIEPFAGPAADPVALRPDAAYLITGGLGGLGLRVARWMFERGARNIVLLGRHDPSPAAQAVICELREGGATVTTVSADVGDAAELGRVFARFQTSLPALRGVVHAAGVYGHGSLGELDARAFERLLRPKVQGTWLLHQLTSQLDLDFFVCFSSIAALWGSKGQAHYAAANSFLDALAHYRHRRGLPALSIGWGPWMGDGMVTGEAHDRLARIGVRSLRPEDALAALERALCCGEAQIAIADMDWARFRELYAFGGNRGLFADIAPVKTAAAMRDPPTARVEAEFSHLTVAERHDWLVAHLQREVSAVLGLGEDAMPDARAGFFRLGMDSLMAVDLRDRLSRTTGVPLSVTIVFDYPNITELAVFLATDVFGWEKPAQKVESSAASTSAEPAHGTQSRSESDVQDAIALKLARLETLVRET